MTIEKNIDFIFETFNWLCTELYDCDFIDYAVVPHFSQGSSERAQTRGDFIRTLSGFFFFYFPESHTTSESCSDRVWASLSPLRDDPIIKTSHAMDNTSHAMDKSRINK